MSARVDDQAAESMNKLAVVKGSGFLDALGSFDVARMTDVDEQALIEGGTWMRDARDVLKEDLAKLLSPLHEHIAELRARYGMIGTLDEAVKLAKKKLVEYRDLKVRRAQEAQRAAEKSAREAARQAAVSGGPAPPPADVELEAPGNVVRAGMAQSVGRKVTKFRVVDAGKAATTYPHLFKLDEAGARLELKVAQARDPQAQLTGIEHYYEQDVSFQRR